MAIENEFKFIIRQDKIDELMALLKDKEGSRDLFHQVYISDHARLRKIIPESWENDEWVGYDTDDIVFTYKQMINGTLLEFETYDDISTEQFELVCGAAVGSLRKYRYTFTDRAQNFGDSRDWEFDFLLGPDDAIYFGMIEVEVPAGVSKAPTLPDWIEPFVSLAIPQNHNFYFTNFRLSNQEYAKNAVQHYLDDLALISD